MDLKNIISQASSKLLMGDGGNPAVYPNTEIIINIIDKLKIALFPEYWGGISESELPHVQLQSLLADIYRELTREIRTVLPENDVSQKLIEGLADIQQLLYKDAQAGFEGDPAARSVDEVILTYPGFFAVFVYRIAHFLFLENVPFIPRIMSEHAHSITGIDIHPGAKIGEYFFIDHGTGVVIGETSVIGNRVKLYQGVTLGALSTRSGQKLAGKKRHPTIEDNVIIYSGASILGGDTVIGEGAVIGGNAFIVKSIPAKMIVRIINPELQYNEDGQVKIHELTQPGV
ncbi:MAG TPA: serine acetyltransferase [Clostridiaceae bacterium]|nr:serine acetyltransferase [Clostridiaceae bacterium]